VAERANRLPGNLRGGLAILTTLLAIALLAPLLATDLPWITRTADGLRFPAFSSWTGERHVTLEPTARPLLRAPVPHGPNRVNLRSMLEAPSAEHWLGTDDLGRDLAARVIHGARVSLAVGLLSAALAVFVGVPLGAWAGYRGGWADFVVSRAVEAVLSFPTLLLVLAVLTIGAGFLTGLSEVARIALVLGLTGWMPIARYVRGEFLRLRESDMVAAARAVGGGDLRIV